MSAVQEGTSAYDPFTPAVMSNPLPYYKALRKERPVAYLEKYDGFFFSRFADIFELLGHVDDTFVQSESSLPTPATLRNRNTGAPQPPAPDAVMPIAQKLGMPITGEVRRAHIKPLMPRGVAELTDFVREQANERLDGLLPQGRFNLTREYGGLVASRTIMRLMGLPLELAEESLDIINSGTRTDPESGGFDASAVAQRAVQLYLPFVAARAKAGPDGSLPLMDNLFEYRYNGRLLTPPEIATQLVCAFIGGIETVPKIVAHGLMELSNRPDQMGAVRADLEANVPKVVEEMIRYCAPAQWFMRTAHKPVTVAGQKIEPGQRAFIMIASANRDEAEFENPDEFHWDRQIRRQISFGHGIHVCTGLHLARMEIRVMVDAFLRRVPAFSFDMTEAVRPPSSFQWGWNALPVVIG